MLVRRQDAQRQDLQADLGQIERGFVPKSRRNKGTIFGFGARVVWGERWEGGDWLLDRCRDEADGDAGVCLLISNVACAGRHEQELEEEGGWVRDRQQCRLSAQSAHGGPK